jgi:hypothetical protein
MRGIFEMEPEESIIAALLVFVVCSALQLVLDVL